MTIKIEGFSEVLDMLKELFSGLKSALEIPEANRKEMRDALADTAELIDETLTILKQHLSTVVSELKFGDQGKAKRMIYELGSFQGWEDKYRQFQLCDALRGAAFNLERKGLYNIKNKISVSSPQILQQRMWDYIGGETNAANSIGTMLMELSRLSGKVDLDMEEVIGYLERARNEVSVWRQKFIDVEQEIRSSVR